MPARSLLAIPISGCAMHMQYRIDCSMKNGIILHLSGRFAIVMIGRTEHHSPTHTALLQYHIHTQNIPLQFTIMSVMSIFIVISELFRFMAFFL